jgi:hypothetical protein
MFGETMKLIFFFCDKWFVCAAIWMFFISPEGIVSTKVRKENSNVTAGAAYELYMLAYKNKRMRELQKGGKKHSPILLWRIPLWLRHQHFLPLDSIKMEIWRAMLLDGARALLSHSLSHVMSGGCNSEREHVNKSTHTSTSAACAARCVLCVEKTCVLCAGGEIKSGDAWSPSSLSLSFTDARRLF